MNDKITLAQCSVMSMGEPSPGSDPDFAALNSPNAAWPVQPRTMGALLDLHELKATPRDWMRKLTEFGGKILRHDSQFKVVLDAIGSAVED